MLRVGVSIAAGSITPSTILRRLGTYSRKKRLFQAFRELGVAVRSAFLLQYIGDAELRSTIQAAMNKSESFNDFVKWLAFGGGGVIAENDRGEQRTTWGPTEFRLNPTLSRRSALTFAHTSAGSVNTPLTSAARQRPWTYDLPILTSSDAVDQHAAAADD